MTWLKKQRVDLILLITILLVWGNIAAHDSNKQSAIDQVVKQYADLATAQRARDISKLFLGKPGSMLALGEGKDGIYDTNPLYALDRFSCQTFVETIIALSLANNFQSFVYHLRHIRYQDGKVSFITRNHFPSANWIPNNIAQGYIKNITPNVAGKYMKTVTRLIDIPNWYRHMKLNRIIPKDFKSENRQRLLHALQHESKHQHIINASVEYLPRAAIMNPNIHVLHKIPSGAIVMFVRKKWPLDEYIGTQIIISHMSIAVWKNDQLYLRMVSNFGKTQVYVKDVRLISYLRAFQKKSILGISIYTINSEKRL